MLNQIPIYRLLLNPYSYLRKNNSSLSTIDLIEQLPNYQNVFHRQRAKGLDEEQFKKYYDNQLLLETKHYLRTLLKDLNIENEAYYKHLLENDIEKLFYILMLHKDNYFKLLILKDLKNCGLDGSLLIRNINKVYSVDAIMKELRRFRSTNGKSVWEVLLICIKRRYDNVRNVHN